MAGNANSGKKLDKSWTEALRLELYQNDRRGLRELAKITISRAMAGDMQAVREIADRLEGKPLQQIEAHNVNENHYVRAPAKAAQDDWQKYLDQKAKPAADAAGTNGKSNGSSNGKSH